VGEHFSQKNFDLSAHNLKETTKYLQQLSLGTKIQNYCI